MEDWHTALAVHRMTGWRTALAVHRMTGLRTALAVHRMMGWHTALVVPKTPHLKISHSYYISLHTVLLACHIGGKNERVYSLKILLIML